MVVVIIVVEGLRSFTSLSVVLSESHLECSFSSASFFISVMGGVLWFGGWCNRGG